jgi:uncharacterized protein (TIGR02588 family)
LAPLLLDSFFERKTMDEQVKHDEHRKPSRDIPSAEWMTAAAGLVIVLAVLAFLLIEAVRGSESPPQIRINVLGVEAQEGYYLVRLQVSNKGGSTVAQLVVEGTVTLQKGEIQRSQVTLDYVPARSKRGAGLFFTSDPIKARLEVRAIGYQDP